MIAAPTFTGPDDRAVYAISDSRVEAEASAWGVRKRGGHARVFRRVVRVDHCSFELFIVIERASGKDPEAPS